MALALVASACGDDDTDTDAGADDGNGGAALTIAEAWSRQPAEGQTATAVYGVVSNPTGEDVRIVAAASPVTDTVELHETLMDDEGVMSMQEVEEGFVVPAGGEFTFEPGGPHVMVLGIDPATYPAEVEVTLEFEGADALTFTAEVREAEGTDMGHGDDMDGDMDMSDDVGSDDMGSDDMGSDEMDDGDG